MPRLLRYAFRRLGPRYPQALLTAQAQVGHVVVVLALGLLTLYTSMSDGQFVRLLGVAEALLLVENVAALRLMFRMLRPATQWLRGERTPERTVEAWRALAGLPLAFVRRRWWWSLFCSSLPWCIYASIDLGLSVGGFVILFAGGLIVVLYGSTLRYLAMELTLRPVLEDVARALPDGAELGHAGVPLRWKLLAGLPLINIITGVTVSGLSTDGTSSLSDLGVDVLVAVAVAFTISLELTVLLTRSIVQPIHELEKATRRIGRGDLAARVPVLSTDETGALSMAFNSAVSGLEERERLHEAFGAFVDPDLAERVLREGTVLEGDDVEVSVMFLDIVAFTGFAERSSAREVVARLNEFYEEVVPVLVRHGGHANSFVGDGLLGVFGAPDRLADHADRAVAAAVEIAARVHRRYGDDMRIGIGVNSGEVVAGTIGGGGHVEFTVIGDPVNTAARVERLTRETGDEILITEATRALLTRDYGPLEPRPPAELKGKTERVSVWALRAGAGVEGERGRAAYGTGAVQ
jgi:class 3 adenylate cyclase